MRCGVSPLASPLFSELYGKGGLGVNYENGIALKLLTGAGLGRGSTRRKQSASTVNPQRLADIYDPEGTVLMSATGAIRERRKNIFPPPFGDAAVRDPHFPQPSAGITTVRYAVRCVLFPPSPTDIKRNRKGEIPVARRSAGSSSSDSHVDAYSL